MSKRQQGNGNIVLCDDEQPIVSEMDDVQAKIRQRAFEISLNRNHAGREINDWLAAEAEVIVSPPAELAQKGDEFIVRMAASGIDANGLTIMATRNQLLVKSEFRHVHEPDAEIHSCDFRSSMVFRALRFPEPIDLKSLKSELQDGLLRISARREGGAEAVKPRPVRKIAAPAAKPRKKG